jgi:hypothetical protein
VVLVLWELEEASVVFLAVLKKRIARDVFIPSFPMRRSATADRPSVCAHTM